MRAFLKRLGLLPYLVLAILGGIIIGAVMPSSIVKLLATFNSIFGNFLGFSIPLIIIGFVVSGIGELGKGSGKILLITVLLSYTSMVIVGVTTYFIDKSIFPLFLDPGSLVMSSEANNPESTLISPFFTIQIPPMMDVVSALVISFILGIGISNFKCDAIKSFFSEFERIIALLIEKVIIPLIPIHVLGIFANMTYSGQVYKILGVFSKAFIVIIGLQFAAILFQFSIAGWVSHKNPFKLLKNVIPAYITALGTQSSVATVPVSIKQTQLNGVKKEIANFVMPLCSTIHISGSTITLVSCSIAVLMLNGMPVQISNILPFIMMLGVMMVAAPGVPGGGVMATLGILESMLGFNPVMISLMIALYIAQDSFGTACNVTGDGAIAVIVDKIASLISSDENTSDTTEKVEA